MDQTFLEPGAKFNMPTAVKAPIVGSYPSSPSGHRSDSGMTVTDIDYHVQQSPSRYADDDSEGLNATLDTFLKEGTVPEPHVREAVLRQIHRRAISAILSRSYADANKLNEIHGRFLSAIVVAEQRDFENRREYSYDSKIIAAQEDLKAASKQWHARVEKIRGEMQARLAELAEAQKAELAAFRQKYDDPITFRCYSKPSSAVLQLRAKERSLVILCRFPEANAMSKEAERREAQEAEKMQKTAEWEVLRKQARMLERHEREKAAATEYFTGVIAQTKAMMEQGVTKLKTRIAALEKLKNSPVKAPFVTPGEATTSPRTRESYFEFRQAWPGRKLALKPISGLAQKCPIQRPNRSALSRQGAR
jgi:hypothetical protein